MFVGHYAPALALRAVSPRVPLWRYVVAVQFLDYLWAIFILTGVEKARVTPGYLAASPLDLYFMPYTHSLAAAAFWSIAAAIVYRTLISARGGWAGAALIAAAVFSHWIADLIVHGRDLALYPGSPVKLGFGLWSSVAVSQAVELGLIGAGLLLYARATAPAGAQGRIALLTLVALFIALQAYNLVAPPPGDIREVAISALVAYTLFAAVAFWLDRARAPAGGARKP